MGVFRRCPPTARTQDNSFCAYANAIRAESSATALSVFRTLRVSLTIVLVTDGIRPLGRAPRRGPRNVTLPPSHRGHPRWIVAPQGLPETICPPEPRPPQSALIPCGAHCLH